MNSLGSKIVNGKELRYGFTTGTCATAATKAALIMLLTGKEISTIEVETTSRKKLTLLVEHIQLEKNRVKCAIQKDSGDDPDITNGMFVFSEVELIKEGVVFKAGEGVGTVTKRGLAVSPGNPAINPGPRRMILNEIDEILPSNKGIAITLSIPGGREIARKTFNPKLGIEGGLSILGTTGILEPMSVDAIKETHHIELNQFIAQGCDSLVLVPGNYGNDFVKNILKLENAPVIKVSNYIGDLLMYAENKPIRKILLVGHIGKLIKLAGGIFNTHSKTADGRMEIFAAIAASMGLSSEGVNEILDTNTTDSAIEILEKEFNVAKLIRFYKKISNRVSEKTISYVHNSIEVGTVIFSLGKGKLGECDRAANILEDFYGK